MTRVGRRLTIAFDSIRRDRGLQPAPSTAKVEPGRIDLSGCLTAGGTGWALQGAANCHRRRISVYVTARQTSGVGCHDLEDHAYHATVSDLAPGRYEIRVCHLFVAGTGEAGGSRIAFQSTVKVP